MEPKQIFLHWKEVRNHLLEAVKRIPEEKLEWRPAEKMNSFGDILRHIAGAEDFWLNEVTLGKKQIDWDKLHQSRLPNQLVPGPEKLDEILKNLENRHKEIENYLLSLTTDEMMKPARAGKPTRFWILWHLIEHEIHHRAGIFNRLRLLGIEPPEI